MQEKKSVAHIGRQFAAGTFNRTPLATCTIVALVFGASTLAYADLQGELKKAKETAQRLRDSIAGKSKPPADEPKQAESQQAPSQPEVPTSSPQPATTVPTTPASARPESQPPQSASVHDELTRQLNITTDFGIADLTRLPSVGATQALGKIDAAMNEYKDKLTLTAADDRHEDLLPILKVFGPPPSSRVDQMRQPATKKQILDIVNSLSQEDQAQVIGTMLYRARSVPARSYTMQSGPVTQLLVLFPKAENIDYQFYTRTSTRKEGFAVKGNLVAFLQNEVMKPIDQTALEVGPSSKPKLTLAASAMGLVGIASDNSKYTGPDAIRTARQMRPGELKRILAAGQER